MSYQRVEWRVKIFWLVKIFDKVQFYIMWVGLQNILRYPDLFIILYTKIPHHLFFHKQLVIYCNFASLVWIKIKYLLDRNIGAVFQNYSSYKIWLDNYLKFLYYLPWINLKEIKANIVNNFFINVPNNFF